MAETATYDGPRSMLPEEYDELMELKEIAYGQSRRRFLNYYPHTSRKENFIFENHFILKENGKIVGHVGLLPLEAYAVGSRVKMGGIGGVATHPEHRGKGIMGRLLEYSIEKMREERMPLSVLWGDTQRYRHFGWETAGREIVFQLSNRSIGKVDIGKAFIFRSYREEDVDLIARMHEKEPLRCIRSRRDYEQMLQRTQIEVWLGNEGDSWAYAVFSGNQVIEFGGEPSTAIKLFAFMLQHYPIQVIRIHAPYQESAMLRALYQSSFYWEVAPFAMVKILDLEELLRCFQKQLQHKAELFGVKRGERVTLRLKQSGQQVTLVMEDQLQITSETTGEVVVLPEIEAVRLLFGPSAEEFGENTLQRRLLHCLFPLDFYIWGLDHV